MWEDANLMLSELVFSGAALTRGAYSHEANALFPVCLSLTPYASISDVLMSSSRLLAPLLTTPPPPMGIGLGGGGEWGEGWSMLAQPRFPTLGCGVGCLRSSTFCQGSVLSRGCWDREILLSCFSGCTAGRPLRSPGTGASFPPSISPRKLGVGPGRKQSEDLARDWDWGFGFVAPSSLWDGPVVRTQRMVRKMETWAS